MTAQPAAERPTEAVLVARGTCGRPRTAPGGRPRSSSRRAYPYDPAVEHGFVSSQRMGMDVFREIDPDAPLVVAEAVW